VKRYSSWLAASALSLAAFAAQAVSISYDATSLGDHRWEYSYTVNNDDLAAGIEQFTIYFPVDRYANLEILGSPPDWDSLVIQPEPELPDDGYFDSLALAAPIGLGTSLGGFVVRFEALGSTSPARQRFEIVDPDTFAVIAAGRPTPTVRTVPDPGSFALLLAGLLLVPMFVRSRQQPRSTDAASQRVGGRVSLAAIPLGLLLVTPQAHAAFAVTTWSLVSSTRIDRTVYEYEYRITVRNTGPALKNVKVFAATDAPGITVLDDMASIGDMAARATTASSDTVRLRVDRRFRFSRSLVKWSYGFEGALLLEGRVRTAAGPLANAEVSVVSDRSATPRIAGEYGRPMVELVSGRTNAGGQYSIELPIVSNDEFVTLQSQGDGDEAFLVFRSVVRSGGALLETVRVRRLPAVEPSKYRIRSSDVPALDATNVSTGVAVMLEEAAGGPLKSDAMMGTAERSASTFMMVERAAAIEIARERGAASLPVGVSDTLDLVSNPEKYREFLVPLEVASPGITSTKVAAIAEVLVVPFTAGEAARDWLMTSLDPEYALRAFSATSRVTLFAGGPGEAVLSTSGKGAGAWALDATGRAQLDFAPVIALGPSFPFKAPCDGSAATQIEQRIDIERLTLTRLWAGVLSDVVLNRQRIRYSYPGNPCYPDEILESESAGGARTGLPVENALRYSTAELSGRSLGLVIQHPVNGTTTSSSYNIPEWRYVTVPLNADGTGSVGIRNAAGLQTLAYTWSVSPAGHLLLSFADGTTNQLIPIGDSGPFRVNASLAQFPPGSRKSHLALGTPAVVIDAKPQFLTTDVADGRFRSRLNYFTPWPSFSPRADQIFDFLFQADGRGCTVFNSGGDTPLTQDSRTIVWQVNEAGELDYTRVGPLNSQRRLWRLVATQSGSLGTVFWVDEQFQEYRPGVQPIPNFDNVPGRLAPFQLVGNAAACVLP
jgi:hypothetical protein